MLELQKGGHEFLGIIPDENRSGIQVEGAIWETDLGKIISRATEFNPDLIFLDHYLGKGLSFTGQDIARKINFPSEKHVGISSGFQEYCEKSFVYKKRMRNNPSLLSNFLDKLSR